MADTYKSQATKLTTTNNTTIYSGVAGVGIVNSINLSNVDTALPVNINVFLVKSGTSYSIISNTDIPYGTSLQILDAPLVCASGDTITATASAANDVEVIVSVLEIT